KRAIWQSRGIVPFTDLEGMLSSVAPDVVFVLTPTATHRALAETALRAGFDVVIEKPLAAGPPDADAIVATAQRCGRRALVEESYLWMPSHRRAFDELAAGRIGAVRTIVHTFFGW